MEIQYEYSSEKNAKLKQERGVSFEEIIFCINNGGLLDIIKHSNISKYADQWFYVVDVKDYVHLVLFVREKNKVFLKTIFPNRKHTKQYLKRGKKS